MCRIINKNKILKSGFFVTVLTEKKDGTGHSEVSYAVTMLVDT